jgi:predicted thioesterase
MDDLAPSPVGADLEVDAVLERVAGRRLMFAGGVREVASQERCKRLGCRLHGEVRRRL